MSDKTGDSYLKVQSLYPDQLNFEGNQMFLLPWMEFTAGPSMEFNEAAHNWLLSQSVWVLRVFFEFCPVKLPDMT